MAHGYRSVEGGKSWANIETGEVISRRQYDNVRARAAGWASSSQFQRRNKDPSYRALAYAANKAGKDVDTKRMDSQFNRSAARIATARAGSSQSAFADAVRDAARDTWDYSGGGGGSYAAFWAAYYGRDDGDGDEAMGDFDE